MADLKEQEIAVEAFVDAGIDALACGVLVQAVRALADALLAEDDGDPMPGSFDTIKRAQAAAERAVIDGGGLGPHRFQP